MATPGDRVAGVVGARILVVTVGWIVRALPLHTVLLQTSAAKILTVFCRLTWFITTTATTAILAGRMKTLARRHFADVVGAGTAVSTIHRRVVADDITVIVVATLIDGAWIVVVRACLNLMKGETGLVRKTNVVPIFVDQTVLTGFHAELAILVGLARPTIPTLVDVDALAALARIRRARVVVVAGGGAGHRHIHSGDVAEGRSLLTHDFATVDLRRGVRRSGGRAHRKIRRTSTHSDQEEKQALHDRLRMARMAPKR